MKTDHRDIIRALQHVRVMPHSHDDRFIRSMDWVRRHEPHKRLTPGQRFHLQLVAYRYRTQLAGNLKEELIPTQEPNRSDYIKEKPQMQRDFLDGTEKPVEFEEPLQREAPGRNRRLI